MHYLRALLWLWHIQMLMMYFLTQLPKHYWFSSAYGVTAHLPHRQHRVFINCREVCRLWREFLCASVINQIVRHVGGLSCEVLWRARPSQCHRWEAIQYTWRSMTATSAFTPYITASSTLPVPVVIHTTCLHDVLRMDSSAAVSWDHVSFRVIQKKCDTRKKKTETTANKDFTRNIELFTTQCIISVVVALTFQFSFVILCWFIVFFVKLFKTRFFCIDCLHRRVWTWFRFGEEDEMSKVSRDRCGELSLPQINILMHFHTLCNKV